MDDQVPDPKQIIGGTFSAAADSYDEVIGFFAPFGRALVGAAGIAPGDRVLDVACGRGACLYPALAATGPTGSVLGVDLAAGMVDRLGAELAAAGVGNARTEIGDAEQLAAADAGFDVVLAGFLIFFAPDPPQVLREFHRVLRPGGKVALSIFDGPGGFAFIADIATELFGPPDRRPSDEYNKAEVLLPALVEAGFARPDVAEVTESFLFDGPDQVEAWMRSHGGRLLFARLDEPMLARFRTLLSEHLEAHRTDAGFVLEQRALMVVASRD